MYFTSLMVVSLYSYIYQKYFMMIRDKMKNIEHVEVAQILALRYGFDSYDNKASMHHVISICVEGQTWSF